MFTSLSQFYNSKEWRAFRGKVISERTSKKDGTLYDEITGEPLVKAYDIILHHKIPLTMRNVNIAEVSLNPENVIVISHQMHNVLHDRFGGSNERKVYIVCGAPCSGKNTYVQKVKGNGDLIVDIDLLWSAITGGEKYQKPNALKANAFGLRDCLIDMVKTRTGKWERAYVITGGALRSERRHLADTLGAEVVMLDTTKEECLKRLYNDRERDHEEWKKYIEQWFDSYQTDED